MKFKLILLISISFVFGIISPISAIQIPEEKLEEFLIASKKIALILDEHWGFQSWPYEKTMDSINQYENKFRIEWDDSRLAITWLVRRRILWHYTNRSLSDYQDNNFNIDNDSELKIFRLECEKHWWNYEKTSRLYECVLMTPDVGDSCNDWHQCLWYCLADSGTCSVKEYVWWCADMLRNWSEQTICS